MKTKEWEWWNEREIMGGIKVAKQSIAQAYLNGVESGYPKCCVVFYAFRINKDPLKVVMMNCRRLKKHGNFSLGYVQCTKCYRRTIRKGGEK